MIWSDKFKPSKKNSSELMLEFSLNYLEEKNRHIELLFEDLNEKHLESKLNKKNFKKFEIHFTAVLAQFLLRAFEVIHEPRYADGIGFEHDFQSRLDKFKKGAFDIIYKHYWETNTTEDIVDILNVECLDKLIESESSEIHIELSDQLRKIYTEIENEVKKLK